MSRVRSIQFDDQDQIYWDGGQEVRKAKSDIDRCKKRKSKSIRHGINDYWDKRVLRDLTADSFDDSSHNNEDNDEFQDETLH